METMAREQIYGVDDSIDRADTWMKYIPGRRRHTCKGPEAAVSGMHSDQQGCHVMGEE
jgi:hypothetical protein